MTKAKSTPNSNQQDDQGTPKPTPVQTAVRNMYRSSPAVHPIELESVTDAFVDLRAIGYRAISVGGKDSSFEPLAELIAMHNLEGELAAAMADGELMYTVFSKLFPKHESSMLRITTSQGLLTLPLIIREFRVALGGVVDSPARVVLSQVMAILTAHSLKHLSIVMPFDGFLDLSEHTEIFPTASVIVEAAKIKRLTDILESMRLDPEIGKVKTLSGAALYSAMQPMFSRAARLMMSSIQMDIDMQETFLLMRLYLTRDPALPKSLVDNDDLRTLATNLTLVLAAMQTELRPVQIPEWQMAQCLAESSLRLRELKRFKIVHLSEIKQWYVHYALTDHPGQKVTGLIFGRNLQLENRPQVTVFTQIEKANYPVWTQLGFPAAENRIEPLLASLLTVELKGQTLAAAVMGAATYLTKDIDVPASVYLTNGATELELMYYAASVSRRIILGLTEDGHALIYANEDVELNYDSMSIMGGTLILSQDPAEAVIHSGLRENVGEGAVPCRIQGIPDANRNQLVLTKPADFTVNLGEEWTVSVVIDKTVKLEATTSLADLLYLPSQLRLSMTEMLAARSLVGSHFDMMLAIANKADVTDEFGTVARLRAAMSLSAILLNMGASPSGRALTKTVMLRMVQKVADRDEQQRIRGRLRQAVLSYRVAMVTGANLLVAFGLLTNTQAEDAINLINVAGLETYMIGSVPNLTDLI